MMKNRQELEEKAYEWVAYCTDCKAAVEVDDDPHIVQAAALTHVNRFHGHQVIVGQEILGRSYGVCVAP